MSRNNINGKVYDWTDISIMLPSGETVHAHSITYNGGLEKEIYHGKGGKAQGWGRGNYEAEGSVTMLREEFENFLDWCSQQGYSIHQIPPFEITVNYSDYGQDIRTDTLYKCLLKDNIEFSMSNGDTSVETEISFFITGGISFNGVIDYDEPK